MIDLQKSARCTRVRRASTPGEDASRRRASFGPRRACVAAQAPGR
ncbi:serine/threonine protein phosphatase [Burkholderia pseudomallei]|nr:serine/threonine protein phosphatase [Burkholderia pseudomallei]